MAELTRRGVLHAGGTALGAMLAGCQSNGTGDGAGANTPTPATDTDTPTPDGDTDTPTTVDGTDTPSDGGGGPEVTEVRVWQLGGGLGAPQWHEHDGGPAGFLALFDSPERVEAFLHGREMGEERAALIRSVAGDTDFSTSLLLFAESVGPDTCHREVGVEGVAIDDGRIVGTAVARDGGDGRACGEAITFPAALVRVTVDGDVPGMARFTVVDGWGNEGPVDATRPG